MSHAVIGGLIVRAGSTSESRPRGVVGAGVLGALSPDVDGVLMPIGWDIYLRAHEVGTHSVAGAIVTALASAGVVRLLARGSRYRVVATAAVAGAISHVAGDLVSGATIRPAWPAVDLPTPIPLVAMADPWPMAVLAAGLVYLWRFRPPARQGARRVLLALVIFLALKATLLGLALSRSPATGGWRSSEDRLLEARWGSLTEWYVFGRTGSSLRQWTIDARGGTPTAIFTWPLHGESDLIAASRSLDTVRNFLHVHDLGFAVQRPVQQGRQAVLWSDIRFCRQTPAGADTIDCALWFGGIYGPDGRLLTQQVRVGWWIQNRPPPARRESP